MSQNNTKLNGSTPRKQLSEQLDRLDTVIDALDAGLNEVVADAVRQAVAVAVKEAVQAVIHELLSNPDVLRAVASAAPQTQTATGTEQSAAQPMQTGEGILSSARRRLSRAWNGTVATLVGCAAWVWSALPAVRGWGLKVAGWARKASQFVWKHRIVAGASLAVGLAVGVASYFSGPTVSSTALAVCSAVMSAVAFVVLPFTNFWSRLSNLARRTFNVGSATNLSS